ncbi:MAG: hypothetical protein ACXVYB_00005 [Arthrobacter sp.]
MSNAKLNAEDVLAIHERLLTGEPGSDIARDFAVSQQTVSAIRSGKSWGHVTGLNPKDPREHNRRGVLTREQVLAISDSLRNNGRAYRLAKEYGVSPNTIYQIKVGQTWAWLTGRLVCERG